MLDAVRARGARRWSSATARRPRTSGPGCERCSTRWSCPPSRSTPSSAGASGRWDTPPVMEELKAQARERGLWNLFLPGERARAGLTNLEYAPLAEISGRSPWITPEAMNCSAPDTGNMELLAHFATATRAGPVAPAPARGRDPLGVLHDRACRRQLGREQHRHAHRGVDGDDCVITGRKWWSSGAHEPALRGAHRHGPVRRRTARGTAAQHGGRARWRRPAWTSCARPASSASPTAATAATPRSPSTDVWVPRENLLGELHGGFAIAQARLGPGPDPPRHAR